MAPVYANRLVHALCLLFFNGLYPPCGYIFHTTTYVVLDTCHLLCSHVFRNYSKTGLANDAFFYLAVFYRTLEIINCPSHCICAIMSLPASIYPIGSATYFHFQKLIFLTITKTLSWTRWTNKDWLILGHWWVIMSIALYGMQLFTLCSCVCTCVYSKKKKLFSTMSNVETNSFRIDQPESGHHVGGSG